MSYKSPDQLRQDADNLMDDAATLKRSGAGVRRLLQSAAEASRIVANEDENGGPKDENVAAIIEGAAALDELTILPDLPHERLDDEWEETAEDVA